MNAASLMGKVRNIDFTRVVWLVTCALLVYLVATPVVYMLYESLTTETGQFTLQNFVDETVFNSFISCHKVVAVCVCLNNIKWLTRSVG